MLILDMPMPRACDDCPMLDDSGDYPLCRITQETRGYNFNTRGKRMDRCPIKGELTRCGECKHRPKYNGPNRVVFPDEVCPCQCDDCYYNWMPSDDWFCADGERKEDEND